MLFFLGTHKAAWLSRLDVPLFISRRAMPIRRFPRALAPWALDSGGFTELNLHGAWSITPAEYATLVRRYQSAVGALAWCAPMDWMCEPFVLARTGLSIAEHQRRTVVSFLDLRAMDLPVIPVLQGWMLDDYRRCVDMYTAAGVDLRALPVVGLGSVCRRQDGNEAAALVRELSRDGLRLHGFGFKMTGLTRCGRDLASADSLSWSFRARRSSPLPGCTHRSCQNCPRFALRWRERVLRCVAASEAVLPGAAAW